MAGPHAARSVTQFSELIGYSKTAVGNWIAELEQSTGRDIGQKGGAGRSTLLCEEEQRLLCQYKQIDYDGLFAAPDPAVPPDVSPVVTAVTPEVANPGTSQAEPVPSVTEPGQAGGLIRVETHDGYAMVPGDGSVVPTDGSRMDVNTGGKSGITIYKPVVLNLHLKDYTGDIEEVQAQTDGALHAFTGNQDLIAAALKHHFQQEGTRVGNHLSAIKTGAVIQAIEQGDMKILQQLGLVQAEPTDAPQEQTPQNPSQHPEG
jgi:hypothetical protein